MTAGIIVFVLMFQKEGNGKNLKNQLNLDATVIKLNNLDMNLKDLNSLSTLEKLNEYFMDHSYISGYSATQADTKAFEALSYTPPINLLHCLRWYIHIQSFGEQRKYFPQVRQHCFPAYQFTAMLF